MSWLIADGADAWGGTPVESLQAAADSLRSGSWVPAVFDVAFAGMDVVAAGSEFMGEGPDGRRGFALAAGASSLVAGWVVDHLGPLQSLLDEIVGNSATVRESSSTLFTTAATFGTASHVAGTTCTGWKGLAADAEHRLRSQVAATSAGVSSLLQGVAEAMNVAAAAIDAARSIAEGLIADLVASVVKKAALNLVPMVGTAVSAAWMATDVALTVTRVRDTIRSLRELADLLRTVLKSAKDALKQASRWLWENRPDRPTRSEVRDELVRGVNESLKHSEARRELDQSAVNSMP